MPIPPEIEPIWKHAYDEAVMVHAYWNVFQQLFAQPQNILDLLDRSAGFFFRVVRDTLATDIQLSLSKLSDPAMTGNHENATLQYLLREIEALQIKALTDRLRPLSEQFIDACEPIRTHRNKLIAHTDRAVALNKTAPLPAVTVANVKAALSALAEFMNMVESHFEGPETAYELFSARGEGAEDLVWLLKMAERYQALQNAEVIPYDDLDKNWQ